MQPADTEQFMGHKGPFIRGTSFVCRQSPTAHKFFAPIQAENRIGIADIYD
jgi:hypothetical protein